MLTGTYAPGDGLGVPVALIDRGPLLSAAMR
jgi:hypothetical protein